MESVLRRPNRQVRRCRRRRRRELRVFSYNLPPPAPSRKGNERRRMDCLYGRGSFFSKNRVFSGGSAPSPPRACLALVHRFILCFLEAGLASTYGGAGAQWAPGPPSHPPLQEESKSFLADWEISLAWVLPTPCPPPVVTVCAGGKLTATGGGFFFFLPKGAYGPLGNPPFLRGKPPSWRNFSACGATAPIVLGAPSAACRGSGGDIGR